LTHQPAHMCNFDCNKLRQELNYLFDLQLTF